MTVIESIDRISLAYWFPILQSTKVRVPQTEWWKTEANLWSVADGEPDKSAIEFMEDLKERANEHGYSLFMRTGHTSGKHSWKDSCFVAGEDRLGRCAFGLIEASLMTMPSLPLDTWAIREYLHLHYEFKAFWGEMPIAVERRYFIEGGTIICSHPYWPKDAFKSTSKPDDWEERLERINAFEPPPSVRADSEHISASFDGAWSLDWAMENTGLWYAIDMAPAEVSYHWPDCDLR